MVAGVGDSGAGDRRPLGTADRDHRGDRDRNDDDRPEDDPPEDDGVLVEPKHDRWHWRRKIRSNRHHLRVYRVIVGVAGLLCVALGFATGWLPGPGGIPLILLGLAIWASEFQWANRLMQFFKARLKRFQSWTRPQQTLFWVVLVTVFGLCGYTFIAVMGVPPWMPAVIQTQLQRLPGV